MSEIKVLAINGSPRKDGNTSLLIKRVFVELEKEGIKTELLQLAGTHIKGCMACNACRTKQLKECVIKDDVFNEYFNKMLEADAIILGSPTHVADVSSEMKALIDRACYVGKFNGDLFKRKVGAAVVAARRGGAIHTFDTINHFFLITQMIVVGSSYWNEGIGREIGEVNNDTEGMKTMENLGQNMAWLLKKIKSNSIALTAHGE